MERIWLKQYPAGVPADIDVDAISLAGRTARRKLREIPRPQSLHLHGQVDHLSASSTRCRAALGAYLQSRGLKKGARVALMMPNVLQYPVATRRHPARRLHGVNVNPLYTPRELEHQLKDSGAEAIIVLENFAQTLQAGAGQDRRQARHHRQHGRSARLQGHDRQFRRAQGQEDGAGIFHPGRGRVQRRGRGRPRHEAQQAARSGPTTSRSCNIPAAPPAFPRARRCSTATSSPTCCRTMRGCSRR